MQFIDLQTQQTKIKDDLDRRMAAVLEHGKYINGPEIGELEEKLAAYTGAKHCVAVSSGTDALYLALLAYGLKPGDEVITTPFTFIATAEVIALLGATPVFVDIDEKTYNLDPAKIEEKIGPATKAIMPVSLYGQCADMDAINDIAAKHKLPVIEDACQSFGASYKGRRSCGLSTVGATSFFPSKPLGCYGDGGALFTSDDNLAVTFRQLREHGQDRRYNHPLLGVNGRLDSIQAAILLAKMEIFEDEVTARGRVGERYSSLLKKSVVVPFIAEECTSVYAQYTIQVENRESFLQFMGEAGIPTAVHYPIPLHLQPVFRGYGYKKGDFPVSEKIAERVTSLPMHPYLSEQDQDTIVARVEEFIS